MPVTDVFDLSRGMATSVSPTIQKDFDKKCAKHAATIESVVGSDSEESQEEADEAVHFVDLEQVPGGGDDAMNVGLSEVGTPSDDNAATPVPANPRAVVPTRRTSRTICLVIIIVHFVVSSVAVGIRSNETGAIKGVWVVRPIFRVQWWSVRRRRWSPYPPAAYARDP